MKTKRFRLQKGERKSSVRERIDVRIWLYLHIEVADDNFAKNAKQEPEVESIILLDLVWVKGWISIAKSKAAGCKIHSIAGEECLAYVSDGRIAVNLTQLRHDKVSINYHISDQAQFIQ